MRHCFKKDFRAKHSSDDLNNKKRDEMEFIYKELNKKIEDIMMKSEEIIIITAFIKKSSIPFFEKIPHNNISIICGIDFFISDPEAIKKSSQLFRELKIFHNPNSVFHPKCYFIRSENQEYLVVGSSNMTLGGFEKNYEASLIVKKDYSNEKMFNDFQTYYKLLRKSPYIFDINSTLFKEYENKYNENAPKVKSFQSFVSKSVFNGYVPTDSNEDLKLDDWIFHNSFGIGTVVEKEKNIIDVVFLKNQQQKLKWTPNIKKLNNFTNDLTKDIFSLEKEIQLQILKQKFEESDKNKWVTQRKNFYKNWKEKLQKGMDKEEIHDFFEEAASIWTLFGLKKNILSENPDKFNNFLSVLNNKSISIYERYNSTVKKDEEESVDGIGRAITSSILNILYPETCPVFNNASDAVFEYFGIHENRNRGETPAEKYTRFRLISLILKDKYDFTDLVEVDCFIGYIKVHYINQNNNVTQFSCGHFALSQFLQGSKTKKH